MFNISHMHQGNKTIEKISNIVIRIDKDGEWLLIIPFLMEFR